jgi:hypothetical protein
MIFLNGTNINGVRNQDLTNVSIRIDEAGNFHITAPQYDVQQDSSYHPLMPSELPRFPKRQTGPVDLPQGRFSKETGLPSSYLPGGAGTAQMGSSSTSAENHSQLNSGAPKTMAVEDLPPENLPTKTGELTSTAPRETDSRQLETRTESGSSMTLPPNPIKPVGTGSTRTADASLTGRNGAAAKAKPAQNHSEPEQTKMEPNMVPPPELPPEAQGPSL